MFKYNFTNFLPIFQVKKHKCEHCEYVSAFRADLNKHMSRKHDTVLGQRCKVSNTTELQGESGGFGPGFG